jgi:hypothetical protein
MRRVQQRFGRNAATVEANPAQAWVALDEDHLLAKIGGVKRGGVPSGARAYYDNFCFNRIHNQRD